MRENIVGKEINLNNFKGFLFVSDNHLSAFVMWIIQQYSLSRERITVKEEGQCPHTYHLSTSLLPIVLLHGQDRRTTWNEKHFLFSRRSTSVHSPWCRVLWQERTPLHPLLLRAALPCPVEQRPSYESDIHLSSLSKF